MKKTPQDYANEFCILYKGNLMSAGLEDRAADVIIQILVGTMKQFVDNINNPPMFNVIKPRGKFNSANKKEK